MNSIGTKQSQEPSICESVAKIAHQFAAQQSSWLKTLGPTIERLKESFYPPNLRGTEDLEFEDVEKVVMADSIALYGVPRAAIAEALIRADSAAKRRQILGRRWKTISADCREAVEGLQSELSRPMWPSLWRRWMRSTATIPPLLRPSRAHLSTACSTPTSARTATCTRRTREASGRRKGRGVHGQAIHSLRPRLAASNSSGLTRETPFQPGSAATPPPTQ